MAAYTKEDDFFDADDNHGHSFDENVICRLQAFIRAFFIRKKFQQVRKLYEEIFNDIETDICPDGKTSAIQWREPVMSKPCVLPKSRKTSAVAVKEITSGNRKQSHKQPPPDFTTPFQDADYQVHVVNYQNMDKESYTKASVKGQDVMPQQECDNESNQKYFNNRDISQNIHPQDQQAGSIQNHPHENHAKPDSHELVMQNLHSDQEDLQLPGDSERLENGLPSPIDNYTPDFESYTATTASQASYSFVEKSNIDGLMADNTTSPTAQSAVEERGSSDTEVLETVHLMETCLKNTQKIAQASATEDDLREVNLNIEEKEMPAESLPNVNQILFRKFEDDVSLTDSKAGGAKETVRPDRGIDSKLTGYTTESLADSERCKTAFGVEALHAPLNSQAIKTDNGTKDSIRNDVTEEVHNMVPNGASPGEKLTDLSDREAVTDTMPSLSHLLQVTDNNQRDLKMADKDKDGDEREDAGNGLSLREEGGGEKCKSVILGRMGGEQELSIVADMTSVWSNENSFTELTDYPSDLEELKQMRNTTALELLWVQQAISSRKNYLRLKSNLESSE